MQSAETVLGVLRERGRKGLPLDELYRQLFNPHLYLLAFFRINFCPFYVFSYEFCGGDGGDYRGLLTAGIPRSVGPVRRLRSMLRSRLVSLRLAASRLT